MLTATVTREIPAIHKNGVRLDIRSWEWWRVKQVAKAEFRASLDVAFLDGRNRKCEPPAKYVLVAAVNVVHLNAFIDRIDPLISDVIERHAHVPILPAR
ncbi:MAG: hypothetical protein JO093_13680 [Acidobacteria bacterium]|nr:hypothetical protein [Acidobacteriota bacterium]MBV9068516.1 hypothetical protein [Acidobacteriota bacterium]MBV9186664.1 hypothetical protein [Acidobacteriota bacterium]